MGWAEGAGVIWEKVDKFILKAQIVNILSSWAMKSLSQLLTAVTAGTEQS